MSIEDLMQAAMQPLWDKKINAQLSTANAVIDRDEVTEDVRTGAVSPGADGKLDPNPNFGVGSKPGICTISVYAHPIGTNAPEGARPILVLDEVAVADHGWTGAAQITDYILGQLGR